MSHPDSGPLVYRLHRLLTTLRTQISAALVPVNVSFSQYVCLQILHTAPGQSNADLARAMGVTPQAMSGVLLRMQADGLIDRPDTVDSGRARPASLTRYGRRILERADAAVRGVEESALLGLTDAQRDALLTLSTQNFGGTSGARVGPTDLRPHANAPNAT
ncbi:MarR family winged helix-turn-helix transcriptional regulator [Mycolicibacterium chlorophenolicum]|uniref:MarR family winged helix-turn-helix transcriptional regulator n=1 Tax=Mycolicibacterium chlorophenolicum TaxID=37916 RepID=UPI0009E22CDF|nr:MarR family transcriptional regulator [Mycolicibacterium chlorophenolicum]